MGNNLPFYFTLSMCCPPETLDLTSVSRPRGAEFPVSPPANPSPTLYFVSTHTFTLPAATGNEKQLRPKLFLTLPSGVAGPASPFLPTGKKQVHCSLVALIAVHCAVLLMGLLRMLRPCRGLLGLT